MELYEAQKLGPLDLHFKKDYQVRNFYNSKVLLSELEISKDFLENSLPNYIHLTSPGCDFKKTRNLLNISNDTEIRQESYINLGKVYNYSAIDFDIHNHKNNLSSSSAVLSIFKDKDNQLIVSQSFLGSNKKEILFEVIKGGSVLVKKLCYEQFSSHQTQLDFTLQENSLIFYF